MPRKIPDYPYKPESKLVIDRNYLIELITPMVGGGASPAAVDLNFPIRSTAIRGHLRFWWRMIQGFSLGEKMWRREEEIFGSTEFPSPLQVQVHALAIKEWVEYREITNPGLKYLLFPLIENEERLAREGISFRLALNWDSEDKLRKRRAVQNQIRNQQKKFKLPDEISAVDDEIINALRAWITFGGVGARTRRGCGALFANNPNFTSHSNDVKNWLRQFVHCGSHIEKIFYIPTTTTPIDAWKYVVEKWRKFRQPGPVRRGEVRRRFPEAETIRRVTGRRSLRTREMSEAEMPSGFPRAELGLPIIFQFKDDLDPEDTTVNQTGVDSAGKPFHRMASPFILKPLAVVGKGQAVPMIVLLKSPRVSSVRITPNPAEEMDFQVQGSPIVDSSKGSAIEAFLKFIDAAGFKDVTL